MTFFDRIWAVAVRGYYYGVSATLLLMKGGGCVCAQLALLLVFVLFCPTSTSTLVIIRICMRTPAQCGSFIRQWPLVSASVPAEKKYLTMAQKYFVSMGLVSAAELRRHFPDTDVFPLPDQSRRDTL